jgi:nucleotide-binding universal stress UspA family protein
MSYSSLLVHLDTDVSNAARLRVVGELAERFDSRVIGASAGIIQPMYFLDGAAAQDLLEKDQARLAAAFAQCEKELRTALTVRKAKVEWRSGFEGPTSFLAREGRAADLLIVGSNPAATDPLQQVNPGELAMSAGRPVLVLPEGLDRLNYQCIVVAWKDSREARRAVADALPLLHHAAHVLVVEMVDDQETRPGALSRVTDVAAWLVRRGISASAVATKVAVAVADEVGRVAREEGANVVVAGAYGRTRLHEWVFGGVTRSLLQQKELALLLSH